MVAQAFLSCPSKSNGRLLDVSIFSFHLVRTTPATTVSAMLRPPTMTGTPGLRHAECLMTMALGSPILSLARMQLGQLAVFASWESEHALNDFLSETKLGRTLSLGWHVRLEFLRRWGRVSEFDDLPASVGVDDPSAPVVAVTLARLKLPETLRFIQWGKPVEALVRDHPGTTLALAAMRPPNTMSTFSIWRTQREMIDMVRGRDAIDAINGAKRHAVAMAERERKDFHYEFTTLRFRAIAEHGIWNGRSHFVPTE